MCIIIDDINHVHSIIVSTLDKVDFTPPPKKKKIVVEHEYVFVRNKPKRDKTL